MTKQTHIRVGGNWKQLNNVWQRVSGEWKEQVMPHVRVSGEWKECMSYGPPPPAIGDEYGGGIVAYIFQPDDLGYVQGETHGIIAAAADVGIIGYQWGCYGVTIGGDATATAIGTGKAATAAIVAGCAESNIAARLCNDLVLNDYDDWFLPSRFELNQLYLNHVAIGGFADASYWSSTESSANDARRQIFPTGGAGARRKDDANQRVRAVRYF